MSELTGKPLRAELSMLRKKPSTHEPRLPRSVEYLNHLIENASSEDKRELLSLLGMEFTRLDMPDEEERVLKRIIELDTNDPSAWVGLANFLWKVKRDHAGALAAIDSGIRVASEAGSLLRYCLNERARIARHLNDFELLSETLSELLHLGNARKTQDINFEFDFVANLPDGAVDESLLARYMELRK